jgi:protocatechuate 3,4-dioxygenase beta subunit
MTRSPQGSLRRRDALKRFGGVAVILAGCGGDDAASATDTTSSTASTSEETTSSSTATGETSAACDGEAKAWASGGTAAMTAKACYPDPFAAPGECALLCETTPGPCTADAPDRQDVSEGRSGLPVRLALLIIDADTCAPVPGARVEIWHTQRAGIYSGETPAGMFCYGADPSAADHLYFRGSQTTGADGRVDFDTCYPGWYKGRAIHIHVRVYLGDDVYLTSQLFFDDALNAEIFAAHPDYASFGAPDTTNTSDGVIDGEANLSRYVLEVARMPDGAMLAAKRIAIRGAPRQPSCKAGA